MRITISRRTVTLLIVVLLSLLAAFVVKGVPSVPSVAVAEHGRHTGLPSSQVVDAYAGNATELLLTHEQISQGWQGYYGNISGNIILDNSDNQTLYAWPLSPAGEVYAVWNASTPTWNSLVCLDHGNMTYEANIFNTLPSYTDNFTNTFNISMSHPKFNLSDNHIPQNSCNFSIWLHVNEAYPSSSSFNETLLFDPVLNITVYTALVNNDVTGFDGGTWDFEIIVPEDGWNSNEDALTYYFYIELD